MPHPRGDFLGKVGAVFGLVGIVLVAASFVGPWWTLSVSVSVVGINVDADADFGLFGATSHTTTLAGSSTATVNYSDNPNIGSVFRLAMIFMVLGAGFGGLMIALSALSGARPNLRKFSALMGVLAFVLALLGPLYVMTALPAAVNQESGGGTTTGFAIDGFFGSESVSLFGNTVAISYAGGWGWYLALVGAIVLLVGAVASLRATKVAPAGAPMYAPPLGYYPPPPSP